MNEFSKGEEIDHFDYEIISLFKHYFRVSPLNIVCLVLIAVGMIQNASLLWLSVFVISFIWFNGHWFQRLTQENSFPHFTLFEDTIEVSLPSTNEKLRYLWEQLSKVRLVSPFERKSRGMLKFLEGRPGFELTFKDDRKVMVYQRIKGYSEFYKYLAKIGVNGCEEKLPIYDRLNMYGQSIDGDMSSVNNYGEPKEYIDIK